MRGVGDLFLGKCSKGSPLITSFPGPTMSLEPCGLFGSMLQGHG